MPEVLLRMKVANNHSLKELQEIFNIVMNKVKSKQGPCISTATAALYYFPDVFAQPRDEYIAAMLKEIAMHRSETEDSGIFNMSCYLGNVHVSPIMRILKTFNSDGVQSAGPNDSTESSEKRGRSVLRHKKTVKKKSSQDFVLDYIKLS